MGAGEKQVWLALVGAEKDGVRCSLGAGEAVTIPRDQFVKSYGTQAVVLWRDPAPDAGVLKPDMEGDQVRSLQRHLRQLGRYEGEPTGVYDAATTRAVSRLQSETALKDDGKAGKQVRMVLCSWSADYPTPSLHDAGAFVPAPKHPSPKPADVAVTPKEPPVAPLETTSAPAEVARAEPAETPEDTPKPVPETILPKNGNSGTTNTEADATDAAPMSEETPEKAAPEEVAESVPGESDETAAEPAPQVTIVDLPEKPEAFPPPSPRDVEALLADEVYGEDVPETDREVTSPLYTGAPLVPHRAEKTETASGENG
jgi:peptidoglycan hydrolase-like protein with peptidoglycan-binding domain